MQLLRNRYRPPRTSVADFDPPGRGARPAVLVIAMSLLWGLLLLQTAVLGHSWSQFTFQSRPMTLFMVLLTLLWMINAGLVLMLQLNQDWARYAYLVIYLVGLPLALYPLWLKATGDPLALLWR